ncbi:MAG: 3',5'-cyclic-nucleotide phosphodiesterase [Nitrospirota bacterium]
MKIKVLGCSGAKMPGHNVPGFLLDEDILFDAGSLTGVLDEKAQFKIKHIFITHAHLDHIRGIPFFADNIIVGNMQHRVNIFSISPVLRTIKKHLFNSSIWPDFTILPYPDDAILNLIKLKPGEPKEVNSYSVTPFEVNHTVPAVGYLVEDRKNKRFFYTGDTGPLKDTWKKIWDRQIHCLIIDVSFPDSMEEMAIKSGHLTPQLLKQELLKMHHMPERICITHQKPQFSKNIKNDLNRLNIKNIMTLKDGDVIRV